LVNPLVLIGFCCFLVYGVHWTLLKTGLLKPVKPEDSPEIVRILLNYGFWLAIVIVVLGFAYAFMQFSQRANRDSGSQSQVPRQVRPCGSNVAGTGNPCAETEVGSVPKPQAPVTNKQTSDPTLKRGATHGTHAELGSRIHAMERTPPRTTVTGQVVAEPGSVVSLGQQGGQTAQTIINNSPPAPPPPTVSICISRATTTDGEHSLQITFRTDAPITEPWYALYFSSPIIDGGQTPVVFTDGNGAYGFLRNTAKDLPDSSFIFRLTSVNFGLGRWVPGRDMKAIIKSRDEVSLTRIISGSGEESLPEHLVFRCGEDPARN
jgi:hypothetical protein